MAYVTRMKDRRTGEWFRSRQFESFEAAALHGDRLGPQWDWSIEQI